MRTTSSALVALLAAARPAAAAPVAPPDLELSVVVRPDSARLELSGLARFTVDSASRVEFILSRRVSGLVVANERGEAVSFTVVDTTGGSVRYRVRAPEGAAAGSRLALRLSYRAGGDAAVFDVSARGVIAGYNTAWYPQPYSARAASAKVVATLTVDAPEAFRTTGSGVRTEDVVDGGRRRTTFVTTRPTALSFTSAPCLMVRREGRRPITLHLIAPLADADARLARIAEVADALAALFGEFPDSALAIVEVPSAAARGFSGASLEGFFLVDSAVLRRPLNLAFMAHELGHQWWGNALVTRERRGTWVLSEAMAQYGALRVVERLDGPEGARRFREDGYPGYIARQSLAGYRAMAAAGQDGPLHDLPYGPGSHALANSKGFLALDAVARTLGRERFEAALRTVLLRYAGRGITWAEFKAELGAALGPGTIAELERWLEAPGLPELPPAGG